jgi:hypothetical protein
MLIKLSKANKYNPYYALLKMRFNYTCLPFESKLFDADLYFKFDLNNHQNQQQNQQQQQQQQQQNQQQQQYQPLPFFYTQQPTLNTNPFGLFGINGFTGFSGFSNLNSSQLVNNTNAVANAVAAATASANHYQFTIGSNNGNNGNGSNINANNTSNPCNFMAMKQDYSSEFYKLMPQIVGLLEVLPLNFKCMSSSQGTTIEKQILNKIYQYTCYLIVIHF